MNTTYLSIVGVTLSILMGGSVAFVNSVSAQAAPKPMADETEDEKGASGGGILVEEPSDAGELIEGDTTEDGELIDGEEEPLDQ